MCLEFLLDFAAGGTEARHHALVNLSEAGRPRHALEFDQAGVAARLTGDFGPGAGLKTCFH